MKPQRRASLSLLARPLATFGVAVMAATALVATANPAHAAGEQAVVYSPFDGKWASVSSHPSSHGPLSGGTKWAMDVYAFNADVRANVAGVNGNVTMTVTTVENNCGTATPVAGKRVRLEVKVAGVSVGFVSYEHLDNVSLAPGDNVSNGSVLGKTKKWAERDGCWEVTTDQGVHTHMSFRGNTCYVGYNNSQAITQTNPIGVLGSSNTGTQEACTSTPSTVPATTHRVVTRVGGNLWVTDSATTAWQLVSNSASTGNWAATGGRIANLDGNALWIKDGDDPWGVWAYPWEVSEFQVTPTRVYRRLGNNLYVKTSPSSGWSHISASATQGNWKAIGNRVANLDTNGLWVRDNDGGWGLWAYPWEIDEFQVTPTRVYRRLGNNLYVKTSPSSGWSHISASATQGSWKAVEDRVANLDGNGFWVRDGNNGWVMWGLNDVQEFQITPTRIVTRVGGNLWVTDSATTAWQVVSNTASPGSWKMTPSRIVNLDSSGLWVLENTGGWVMWGLNDVQEFQIT